MGDLGMGDLIGAYLKAKMPDRFAVEVKNGPVGDDTLVLTGGHPSGYTREEAVRAAFGQLQFYPGASIIIRRLELTVPVP